jgi:hypothetical protein
MPRASTPGFVSTQPTVEARKDVSFDGVWADIRNRLRIGTEVTGWSREKEDTGLRFKIIYAGPDAITILPTHGREGVKPRERRVGKTDFVRVYAIWRDYCEGRTSRADTCQVSRNTSYIFGILRWREETDELR